MIPPLLTFGIHDFLNASPLILLLKEQGADVGFQIVTDSPAALADRLESGHLDLAMIPSVEYFKSADKYLLIPNLCIASRGPVGTVLLLAKKPLNEINSIAVDFRSRTSVAALKILFPFSSSLEIHPVPPDLNSMLAEHPAALIIGDQGLTLNNLGPAITVYDLSQEWFKQTGKTFVHAVVAVNQKISLNNAQKKIFQKVKVEGLNRIEEIIFAQRDLSIVGSGVLEDYLINKIRYDLNSDAIDGLTHFSNLCCKHGIIQKKVSIKFV